MRNALVGTNNLRKIPIEFINNTNQTFRLRRRCVLDRVSLAVNINTATSGYSIGSNNADICNHVVSSEFRGIIQKLLKKNNGLFAATDKHLGRGDTGKMRIDTCSQRIIKNPYLTPLKLRDRVDKAIDVMSDDDKLIEKSRSSWSFPIVLAPKKKKKDGTKLGVMYMLLMIY